MRISLIQSSHNAIGSVYILHDYLYNKNYLNRLKELVNKAIEEEPIDKLVNVHAKTTNWDKLLKVEEMKNFHTRILDTLINIYTLRTPTPNTHLKYFLNSSWGMKHKKGDYTIEHHHAPVAWSGAFYFEVPSDTFMTFPDFNQSLQIKENMLIFFPGITKHSVSTHTSDKERISMAFNIDWHN